MTMHTPRKGTYVGSRSLAGAILSAFRADSRSSNYNPVMRDYVVRLYNTLKEAGHLSRSATRQNVLVAALEIVTHIIASGIVTDEANMRSLTDRQEQLVNKAKTESLRGENTVDALRADGITLNAAAIALYADGNVPNIAALLVADLITFLPAPSRK